VLPFATLESTYRVDAIKEMLQWLDERGITPYIRVKEGPNSPPDLFGIYGIEKFTTCRKKTDISAPQASP